MTDSFSLQQPPQGQEHLSCTSRDSRFLSSSAAEWLSGAADSESTPGPQIYWLSGGSQAATWNKILELAVHIIPRRNMAVMAEEAEEKGCRWAGKYELEMLPAKWRSVGC